MIATKNISYEINSFEDAMDRITESDANLSTPKEICEALGVPRNTYSTWKTRDRVPYEELVKYCLNRGVDLNWFFKNERVSSSIELKGVRNKLVHMGENSSSELNEMVLALEVVLPIMESAELPKTAIALKTMISTYIKYNRPGSDIKMVLEAVAAAQLAAVK